MDISLAQEAIEALIKAYERGLDNDDSLSWDILKRAYVTACYAIDKEPQDTNPADID